MAKAKAPSARQKFYFQFVTTPTSDTPGTAILLHFDNRRYFFGRISEGTQRACIQRGVGIKKVRNIFLTGQTTWNNIGGLTGMILTLADVQSGEKDELTGSRPSMMICGGPKLQHAIACARRFVFRTGMPLRIHEVAVDDSFQLLKPEYSDENINVWALPIQKIRAGSESPVLTNGRSGSPNTVHREQSLREQTVHNMFDSDWRKDRLVEARLGDIKLPALIFIRDPVTKNLSNHQCGSLDDVPHLSPDAKVLIRNPWPAALVGTLPPADNLSSSIAMSYIVRSHPQRGNFLPEKAKELGIKPGPVYAQLTAGLTITLEDGRSITPEMVMTEPEPGKGMAIFDVPTVDYLDDLSDKIEEMKDNKIFLGVEAASWILGPEVFFSPQFRRLVKSLPEIKHLISSSDTNADYLAFDASAASLLRLSHIRPACFHEPIHNNAVSTPADGSVVDDIEYTPIERGLTVQCTPKVLVNREEVPTVLNVMQTKLSCANQLSPFIPDHIDIQSTMPYDDIEIITFGTGSAVPSKYRNVSASLLRIPGLGNYLLDCGENTLGQLRRTYTSDELDDVLCDLRMIWISHLHADHHLGTLSVIHARNEALERRGVDTNLYIVSEPAMADYLRDYSSIQEPKHCVLVSCLNSVMTLDKNPYTVEESGLPIKTFATTLVSHCHGAQAVSITFSNGFKVSYSGDCRPSSNFAKIGLDSDLLLHEATFDDGMEGDAKAKKHCTTGEALGVAAQMRAKHIILTHFSQRYQKIPVLNTIKFADDMQFEEGDEQDLGDDDTPLEAGTAGAGSADVAGSEESLTQFQPFSATSNSTTSTALSNAMTTNQFHIAVAFDLMRVTLPQIRDMHHYYPAIERMFAFEQEKTDARREIIAKEHEERMDQNRGKSKKKPNNPEKQAKNANTNHHNPQTIYDKINRGKSAKAQTNSGINRGRSRSPSSHRNQDTTSNSGVKSRPSSVAKAIDPIEADQQPLEPSRLEQTNPTQQDKSTTMSKRQYKKMMNKQVRKELRSQARRNSKSRTPEPEEDFILEALDDVGGDRPEKITTNDGGGGRRKDRDGNDDIDKDRNGSGNVKRIKLDPQSQDHFG